MLVLLCAVLIVLGLAGIVLPVLPGGSVLVAGAVLLWAWAGPDDRAAWLAFTVAALLVVTGLVTKYVVPGRGLKAAGIPLSTQLTGAVAGVVGFFVVPVVGLLIGFVLGIYLAEVRRLGHATAWRSTRLAVRAAVTSILIDLAAALLATGTWIVAVTVA
ncbi:DUF456 domain-containing protein [Nocardioides sp. BP30]|uniref:DUF456 domain-containing protein n=1 Tax=Nocardioides sp. BP30 TaxID=3036374 RepID=UPI002469ABE1|nr:DUF456 domain-containing protein [Nocardioides sp. BP30]WGL53936.1 DUF456 domain-containing protein [Nocardioides sp. BP30]